MLETSEWRNTKCSKAKNAKVWFVLCFAAAKLVK